MANEPRRPGSYVDQKTNADEYAKKLLEADDQVVVDEKPSAPKEEPSKESAKEAPKTPMDRWRDAISKAGLTEEDADKILDAVLAAGFYQKDYSLFRGKLKVTFRSRDASVHQRLSTALDDVRTNDPRVHDQVMSRINLAASLVSYRGTTFAHPHDENLKGTAFIERLKFVDNLPSPVFYQLCTALAKFDAIVFAALSEGAELGF